MLKWYVFPLCVACLFLFGCGGGGDDRATTISKLSGDAASGKTLWGTHCTVCHGDDGKGKPNLGDDVTTAEIKGKADTAIIGTILNGVGTMTKFADRLKDQEVADIVAHLRTDIQK